MSSAEIRPSAPPSIGDQHAEPLRPRAAIFNFHPAFDPPTSGGEARCYHLWRGLSRHFDIEAVTPTFPGGEPQEIRHAPGLRETRVPKTNDHVRWHQRFDRCNSIGRRLTGFGELREVSALAVAMAGGKDPAWRAAADRALDNAPVVVVENPFLPFIPLRANQLVVYESFNVEFLLTKVNSGGVLGRWATRRVRELERSLSERADIIFACNVEDRATFAREFDVPAHKLFVAPNGVDLATIPEPIYDDAEKDHWARVAGWTNGDGLGRVRALFMGSAFPPNVRAAQLIVERIARATPDVDFLIAGKCVEAVEKNGLPIDKWPSNVRALGFLSDEQRALALKCSHLALNPMLEGSGTNVKMLDFLGSGLPIVSTPVGARGLDLTDGLNAFIASPAELPRTLTEIARDIPRRRAVGLAARRHATAYFQWPTIAENVAQIIKHHMAPSPKRVMVLVDYPVVPADHGGKLRVLNLAKVTAEAGHPVTLLSLNKSAAHGSALVAPGVIEVTVSRTASHRALDDDLTRSLGGLSMEDLTCFTDIDRMDGYRREARALLAKHGPVVLSQPYMAALVSSLLKDAGARPVLHDSQNFELGLKQALFERHPAAASLSSTQRQQTLASFEACERAATRVSDAITTTSLEDLEHIRRQYSVNGTKRMIVAPNGADVRLVVGSTPARRQALRARLGIPRHDIIALFLGSAHPPNGNAAAFIVQELAPRLPQLSFFIAGSSCHWLGDSPSIPGNVRLFPNLDDRQKSALLGVVDIGLNPVIEGSGTNVKLIEYLAYGLAVVATSVGARGTVAESNRHLVVAERPDMAKVLASLAQDALQREYLGSEGRRLAELCYDWRVTLAPIVSWVESVC